MSRPRNLSPDSLITLVRTPEPRAPREHQAHQGEPPLGSVRERFEPLFSADFSAVRVHVDRDAGMSALALGARAYTIGRDIVFAPGHFAPPTAAGSELIAHEHYHVAQDGGAMPSPGPAVRVAAPDSAEERAADRAARTTGNTINLQEEHFRGDTMELSDAGLLTLAHEMGHVWQYQNGGLAYIPSSLIPQIVAGLSGKSRNLAYDWRNAVRNRIDWSEWNAEQQAECISDYNKALRRINAGEATLADYETVTLAEPFISLVRDRIGAPGSSRRRRETPSAAGATP